MSQKAKNRTWVQTLLPILLMLALAAGILLGTAAVRERVWGVYEQPVDDLPVIASTKELPLSDADKTAFHVRAAYTCYNELGKVVAFRVETQATGYNEAVPIVIASTINADEDGLVLMEIEVLQQKESTYYGARIATPEFTARFSSRYMPLYLTGTAGRGAHVDGVSGATLSSQAVVDAINYAGAWVRTQKTKGD